MNKRNILLKNVQWLSSSKRYDKCAVRIFLAIKNSRSNFTLQINSLSICSEHVLGSRELMSIHKNYSWSQVQLPKWYISWFEQISIMLDLIANSCEFQLNHATFISYITEDIARQSSNLLIESKVFVKNFFFWVEKLFDLHTLMEKHQENPIWARKKLKINCWISHTRWV